MGVALDKMDDKAVNSYKQAVHDMGSVVLYRQVLKYINKVNYINHVNVIFNNCFLSTRLARPYIKNWLIPFIKMGFVQRRALNILHNFTDKVRRIFLFIIIILDF